jgi:nucleoside 2-deoxyribosyltransferase
MKPKIYISGPQYLLPNAEEYMNEQLTLCSAIGSEGLHPLNIDVDFTAEGTKVARDIYTSLGKMMKEKKGTGTIKSC